MSRSRRRAPEVLAAVDLGSNSFHMVVARNSGGHLRVVDRLREMVQLAAGLDEQGRLDAPVQERALACLRRFGQRLKDVHADGVRVVGTSALRRAYQAKSFLRLASDALGHPIQVIAGREEARLIYAGVTRTMPRIAGNRLVVDIGGGSTELIVGRGVQPIELESVNLGCVGLSRQCFDGGRVGAKRMAHARVLAQQALEPRRAAFLRCGWASTVGSSGSIRAVFEALKELDPAATTITPDGLEELFDLLCRMKRADDLPLRAVPAERRGVFPGGVAILAAVFSELKLKSMRWSEGAMREGLLYDMVGRYTDEDAREATVRSMQQRYHVDVAQAVRIEKTALQLFRQARERWRLRSADAAQMLSWAARLHEIGLDVAHSGYHRHGAYLLENADMPGFTREEQLLLARIVGGHRRKLALTGLADLAPPADAIALPLLLLLRLAVLLHRSRSEARLPRLTLGGSPRAPVLRVGLRSFRIHPLTGADLNDEVAQLAEQGIRLRVFPR